MKSFVPGQSKIQTLASCLSKTTSKSERKEFVLDFIKTLAEADVPLEKAPKFSGFLKKYCKQGGAIPAPSHLRTDYLPELFPHYIQDIKDAVQGKDLYVILDETTDACGRSALAIMLQPVGDRPVLADLVFLERVNFTTVSQALIRCLSNNLVDFNNVWAIVSDGASYMKKAFSDIFKGLFPNSTHVTCFAHLLNLILQIFPEVFEDMNKLCALVKRVFCQSPQRRRQLREFQQEKGFTPHMPVFAVQTRWCSWITAVGYLAENIDVLSDFLDTLCGASAKCVLDLKELLKQKTLLKTQATFIVEHSLEIVTSLKRLEETAAPSAHTIAQMLEDLQMLFEFGRTAEDKDWRPQTTALLQGLSATQRKDCVDIFQTAMRECSIKLETTMENHPSLDLFKAIPIFNSVYAASARQDKEVYVPALPALSNVSAEEWHRYMSLAKAESGGVSATDWWTARQDRMPTLARIALVLLWLPTSSVDVERVFSHYNCLLRENRRSLKEENVKMMLMIKYNSI